jgi:hypothetical protein
MPRTVDLRTEIPGPKSRAIMARKERVVAEAKSLLAPFVSITRTAASSPTSTATRSSTGRAASAA